MGVGEPAVWDMDSEDSECDCPGPPPTPFHLPPPPRPPFLHEVADCSEAPLLDLETCHTMPVIEEYHSSPVIPSLAVIVVCSILLIAMLLLATVLVWKHKKKMSFLPCKSSPQNRCDVTHGGNGVIYEDLTNIRPRVLPQPSMEMLDVKSRAVYPNNCNYPVISHSPVFICPPPPRQEQYCSQDLYNPVYEELSNGSGERGESDAESEGGQQARLSEDEFAEDELSLGEQGGGLVGGGGGVPGGHSGTSSLQGSTGNDLCRDVDSSDADDRSRFLGGRHLGGRHLSLPPSQRGPRRAPRPRSLDRRRGTQWRAKPMPPPPECGDFHEGLLLDALLQLYPGGATQNDHHRMPYIVPMPNAPAGGRTINPYESIPVMRGHHHPMTTFRPPPPPKPLSHDSDSGYSHNTSGGRGGGGGGGSGGGTGKASKETSHRLPNSTSTHASSLVLS
ncbi:hypothetical protein LSTR_LSTR001251 [Laodelphax striatellus]|uniref:Uncharacterized protein n=1 Tax=Laodelphax striatellus TaxID=195883 RepID=A0A482XBM0_LAOST|nr:hypothetical protein LSTR_LSTR001251 [Laodelphax striatellus]